MSVQELLSHGIIDFGADRGTAEAFVVVPARDEAEALPACLDALAAQVNDDGSSALDRFEILLLLNNCTDGSAALARTWMAGHSRVRLHILTFDFPVEESSAGAARRLLMDTACHRLAATGRGGALLSTDADTTTHPQWVARNLQALANGADAVGGRILMRDAQIERLPLSARTAYQRDQHYRALAADLEDQLDPRPGDPAPRHLDHFGASLACTCDAYARVGGLPRVACLEDIAFIDALRRVDAVIRHDPTVQVYTSSRLRGRSELGFADQLQSWSDMEHAGREHCVLSAAFLEHRFNVLALLRRFFAGEDGAAPLIPPSWRDRLDEARQSQRFEGQFLAEIDCDRLIDATFQGSRESKITTAIRDLQSTLHSAAAVVCQGRT